MNLPDLNARTSTLASPLKWAAPDLIAAAASCPMTGFQLLTAERPRLHFLAFVLAMTDRPAAAEFISQALSRPMRDVLADLGLADIRGLRRVLGRIPGSILDLEYYQLIAKLLKEPSAAAVLHHMPEVTAELLANLDALPPLLRSPIIATAIAHIPLAAKDVVLWIDIAANRLQLPSAEIQRRLGRSSSVARMRTELHKLLDALPALETAPPKTIARATRIDQPSAIRQLGSRFHNCLRGFTDPEIDGTTHIYHWRTTDAEAVCEVARVGNFGWFLGSHLGTENRALPDPLAQQVRVDFAASGILPLRIIETYDDLYFAIGRRETTDDGNRRPTQLLRGRYHPG